MEREVVLDKLYAKINKNIFNSTLPQASFCVTNSKKVLAGCQVIRDNDEYNIVVRSSMLKKSEQDIYETVLHQMFHIFNMENGLSDVSRHYRFHNRNFVYAVVTHGCVAVRDYGEGYCRLVIPDKVKKKIQYDNLADEMEQAIKKDNFLSEIKYPTRIEMNNAYKFYCPVCHRPALGRKNMKLYCGYCHVEMERKE